MNIPATMPQILDRLVKCGILIKSIETILGQFVIYYHVEDKYCIEGVNGDKFSLFSHDLNVVKGYEISGYAVINEKTIHNLFQLVIKNVSDLSIVDVTKL